MAQSLDFETVDVFTQTPYKGNPLAIVHIPAGAKVTQEQKGNIAKEFNLSETIFIHENVENPLDRKLDIFIPTPEEIPFAGHPTIGCLSHIGKRHVTGTTTVSIVLHEKAGDIIATYDPKSQVAQAAIPHNVHIHKSASPAQLSEFQPNLKDYWQQHINRRYPVVSPVKGLSFVLVDLDDANALGRGVTQTREMAEIRDSAVNKDWLPCFMGAYYFVVQSSKTTTGIHTLLLRSRMFCLDVPEDPATGAAACTLAGYLSIERRKPAHDNTPWKKFVTDGSVPQTKYRYEITQGVEIGRESTIVVEVEMKDATGSDIDKILLQGQAVKVMEGKLQV